MDNTIDIWHSKPLPQRPASATLVKKPKGLASLVKDATNDGLSLVAYAMGVFQGEIKDEKWAKSDALQWLADRGFGRATQQVEVDASISVDMLIKAALEARKEQP